ncbi:MAG: fibronectin type III domain-containing protein, partial [Acidimicrobiales bacterium]
PVQLPVTIVSLAGQSSPANVAYAGVPKVTSLINTANPRTFEGVSGAPATGGAPLVATGAGFNQAIGPVLFSDVVLPPLVDSQYTYTVESDTSLSTQSVSQNPGIDEAQVCSVSGCSAKSPGDLLVVYPLGTPKVNASAPSAGPAHGGTLVTVTGENLGCAARVSFGNVSATVFGNAPQILVCGSSNVLEVSAPPGRAGTTVPITVTTAESIYTGTGATAPTPAAQFHYGRSSPSAPRALHAVARAHAVSLSWASPADNGGSRITGYRVIASAKDQRTIVVSAGPRTHSITVRRLVAGLSYTFGVQATSTLGRGLTASVKATPKK